MIDLTAPLGPETPPWPGGVGLEADVTATYDPHGAYVRRVHVDEHIGTHLDAPAHFARGGVTAEAIDASRLVCPALVVDVRVACAADRDHAVTAADLEAFEHDHGSIPAGSAVLLLTGWDAFRDDHARYLTDLRFPGLAPSGAHALVDRGVFGVGIDTMGIDPGVADTFPAHHVTLGAGLWHLEGLVDLHRLPPTGATVIVGALRLVGGSGTPARVFAIVPSP